MNEQLKAFMDGWQEDANGIKSLFTHLLVHAKTMQDVELDFNPRPGISYSLRLKHANQKDRPLFVLIDIIDDDPDARWLSMCFFADLLSEKEEGDVVPGGLFGSDAWCIDVDEADYDTTNFLISCLDEACANAAK